MTKEIILHIGFPKTGTTFLQRYVFPSYTEAALLSGEDCAELRKLLNDQSLAGSPDIWGSEPAQNIIAAVFGGARRVTKIYSNEAWLFGPRSMSPDRKKQQASDDLHYATSHIRAMSEVLSERFGVKTKVLVCLRQQASYLASFYAQHADRFECEVGQEHFENLVSATLRDHSLNAKGYLYYQKLISDLVTTLGRENVGVVFFEEFQTEEFWKKIGLFVDGRMSSMPPNVGSPVNKKVKGVDVWSIRKKPRWLSIKTRRITIKLDRHLGTAFTEKVMEFEQRGQLEKSICLTKEIELAIMDEFRDSNRALFEQLGRKEISGIYT